MFDLLYEEPQTASDIAKSLDMSVQNAKYHLDKFEEAGLIEIIDIWYSDRGREMNVYAPTSSSIILFAGNSNEKRSLRKILKQSLGITGILGIASFLFGWVLSNLRPETIVDTDTDPSNPVLVEGVIQQFTHVVLRGSESVSTGDLLTASERSERAGQGGPEGADVFLSPEIRDFWLLTRSLQLLVMVELLLGRRRRRRPQQKVGVQTYSPVNSDASRLKLCPVNSSMTPSTSKESCRLLSPVADLSVSVRTLI